MSILCETGGKGADVEKKVWRNNDEAATSPPALPCTFVAGQNVEGAKFELRIWFFTDHMDAVSIIDACTR